MRRERTGKQRIETRQRQSSGATVTTRLPGVVRAELACDHVDFCTTRNVAPTGNARA
jgi:hypothetical protein